ncbi:hypothetical protein LMORI2_12170 [Limnohabitans sp. MORI2]|uniref:GSU2403 family nucleotidyltransferase fold protein n=1 Tax=Limnohabitans sp. MORI2 TaxID=1751150 RepID=UPI0023776F89|nr:GSU2403 family nucleotidyltransferase fold protein [Limnohabitans sp. MORI2]BDU58235.1 hypothetical protein LMORI2_12170 [Limnohabitans sp. MORI2]
MDWINIPDNAARQWIDSSTIFQEFQSTKLKASNYAGGMYWKKQGSYEYLVKTYPDNRQQRVGARSAETELIYQEFSAKKTAIEARLSTLRIALKEAERLNKALKVGRAPALLIDILQALEDSGLADHFTVVGTHALYAYEMAAGVRIEQAALATLDVDLLWDARKKVQFISDMAKLDDSVLSVLQRADRTFVRKEGQNESAINATGFEVDFLRRMQEGDDPHPFRFSDDEDDIWPVQAMRASVLTSAPKFERVVVSATGRMAKMRTISPQTFVEFKYWLAEKAQARDPIKRRRDERQARIVQKLLNEQLL